MELRDWCPSFFDELSKIAERLELTPSEQLKEMVQFGAMGAVATPAIGMLSNRLSIGKWVPPASTLKRFVPTGMLIGALTGGALPAARHYISRSNLESARDRAQAQREAKILSGMSSTIRDPKDIERITRIKL